MPDSLQVLNITRHSLTQLLASSAENSAGTKGVDPQEIENTIEGLKGYAQGVRLSLNQHGYALQTDTIKAENGTRGVLDAAVPYGVKANFLQSNTKFNSGLQDGVDYVGYGLNGLIGSALGKWIVKPISRGFVNLFGKGDVKAGYEAIKSATRNVVSDHLDAGSLHQSPETLAKIAKYNAFIKKSGWVGLAIGTVAGLVLTAWSTDAFKRYFKRNVEDLRELDIGYDDYMQTEIPAESRGQVENQRTPPGDSPGRRPTPARNSRQSAQ